MSAEARPTAPQAGPPAEAAKPDGVKPHETPGPASSAAHANASAPRSTRRTIGLVVGAIAAVATVWFLVPAVLRAFNTVSTDDAYVNGHVTFVAARVPGQVIAVLVDDNNRVKKGDLIVQIDPEPYQIEVNMKRAAVDVAEANLVVTQDEVRGVAAQARSNRFRLQHAIEDVDNQIAQLRARVAALRSKEATRVRAKADFERAKNLLPTRAISQQEFDKNKETFDVAEAEVRQADAEVVQTRVSLGLPEEPPDGKDLSDVPDDLNQTFSTVRQALADLLQTAAPLGVFPPSYNASPSEIINEFYKRDPEGNVDRIYAELVRNAPAIRQSQAHLEQSQRDLDQAQLNLKYCDVFAEIDGVVTRRNVNPGNNIQAGQSLMAIRSLTEIWIDANFKETQLARLRIGQPVDLKVDMYGRHQVFKGRITGFTMGTGSTLALLPPQNATGNFVKVVQRLPVRIEPIDYDPDRDPLFIGLSVVPCVYINEKPTGPHAGEFLQPPMTAPARPTAASNATEAAKPIAAEKPASEPHAADSKSPAQGSKP